MALPGLVQHTAAEIVAYVMTDEPTRAIAFDNLLQDNDLALAINSLTWRQNES